MTTLVHLADYITDCVVCYHILVKSVPPLCITMSDLMSASSGTDCSLLVLASDTGQ